MRFGEREDGMARSRQAKGSGTLVKRGKKWFARWSVNGKVFTRSTKTDSITAAREKLKEFTALHRLGNEVDVLEGVAAKISGRKNEMKKIEDGLPATLITDAWQLFLVQPNRPDSGKQTLSNYHSRFEMFVKWMGKEFPDIKELRQITKVHATKYVSTLTGGKVSASTFNRHLNALSLVWRVLEEPAKLTSNPWTAITKKKFTPHSRRELTIAELQKVVAASKGEMRLLLALGVFTGLRLRDCACLPWSSIDVVRQTISVIPSKTARRSQKRVIIPIHRDLLQMLLQIPDNQRKGFLLPATERRYHQFDGALSKDVGKLFENEGIETHATLDGVKRKRADCGFHSLRHTFVSFCASNGVSQSVVQSLVGHDSPSMTRHYTHIGLATAQNAIKTLPSITAAGIAEAEVSPETKQAEFKKIVDAVSGLSDEFLKELTRKIKEIQASRKTLTAKKKA
jgi:integrase